MTDINIQKPRYASSSLYVNLSHETNFSSPISSRAYLLVSVTINSMSCCVKKRPNTSAALSGTVTVGPTDSVNGWMVTGVSVEDHTGAEAWLEDCTSLQVSRYNHNIDIFVNKPLWRLYVQFIFHSISTLSITLQVTFSITLRVTFLTCQDISK